MAIAFDATTQGSDTATSPLTFSHTCGSNSNRYLVVALASTASDSTGVTYGGVSMTLIARVNLIAAVNVRIELWGLVAPATGANNVVVSWAAGPRNTAVVAHSWSGVHQTVPVGTAVTTFTDATDHTNTTLDVPSASDEIVIDLMTCYNKGTTVAVGGGQTLIDTAIPGSAPNASVSYETGAGTTTMSWTWTGNMVSAQIGVALKPATPPTPPAVPMKRGGMFFGA